MFSCFFKVQGDFMALTDSYSLVFCSYVLDNCSVYNALLLSFLVISLSLEYEFLISF